jgi:hypothetical protein
METKMGMNKYIATIGIFASVFAMGTNAFAHNNAASDCRKSKTKTGLLGGVVGGGIGSALGRAVAACAVKPEGAILGAVVGAVIGSKVGHDANDCDETDYTSRGGRSYGQFHQYPPHNYPPQGAPIYYNGAGQPQYNIAAGAVFVGNNQQFIGQQPYSMVNQPMPQQVFAQQPPMMMQPQIMPAQFVQGGQMLPNGQLLPAGQIYPAGIPNGAMYQNGAVVQYGAPQMNCGYVVCR